MTTVTAEAGIRAIALDQVTLSSTGPQVERRKHFNKDAIEELCDSVKTVGVLSAVLVRPINGHFELVFGERRYMAAKLAGLDAIPATVRELTDEQVLEVQLIENLQREGLHELAEAEGYEELQKFGHSAEEIADKLGKSKGYVYGRLKLLALGPAAREAFYRGELNASTALLLARIPVASVQRDAVGKITHGTFRREDGPMSFREARDFIEREYMLRLSDAPFPTGDAELLAKAGACGPCPKRTGNQAELFADVKSKDVCTDPVCFKLKREAWAKLQIAQAKESGQAVIAGPQAKKIAEHGHVSGGYTSLDSTCWEDPKNRTYKQLLGRNPAVAVALLQMPKTGDLVEVVEKAAVLKQLKKDGVIKADKRIAAEPSAPRRTEPSKEEEAFLGLLFSAIHAKAPKKLSRDVLERLIEHEMDATGGDLPQMLFSAWGWDADTYNVEKLTEAELQQFLFEILLLDELSFDPKTKTEQLSKVAKSLGVDLKKVRSDAKLLTGGTAAPAPAAAKKKARGKK